MISSLPYLQSISLKRDLIEDFANYPFSIGAVKELDYLDFAKEVTFLVGENGSGKSTLIEAIAVAMGFNAEGGSKNFHFGTRKTHSDLHRYLRLSKSYKHPKDGFFLRAESFYNVATNIDELNVIDAYGGISLHEQSHGESFLSLMVERFFGNGLYILDEPEAALSPVRQLTVLNRIHELVKQHSQFIIATHSPILMAYPDAKIYQIGSNGIYPVKYEDTEHYEITKLFLENPARMMKALFDTTETD